MPTSQSGHKGCYGTMFPTILSPEADRLISGKVFAYELNRVGGFLATHRKVSVDATQWDECLASPEFDHCHKLSLGRLSLESAISQ
jgi:hypothetical protein